MLQATYPILKSMISSISHNGYATNLHLGDQATKIKTTKYATLAISTQDITRNVGTSEVEW